MKAPNKTIATKTPIKKDRKKEDLYNSKKPSGEKQDSGLGFDQAMQLASTSIDALKSFTDYKKEQEITRRVQIEGQKEIILSEHHLADSCLAHQAKLIEIEKADKDSYRRHTEAMIALEKDHRELDISERRQDRVLDQLESGTINAEQAARLLYGQTD